MAQTRITITPENISDHLWVMDFFEKNRLKNKSYWKNNVVYRYENKVFQLSHPVLARHKKKKYAGKHKFAYEFLSLDKKIGSGAYGTVYPVLSTISFNHTNNQYRIRNKDRVVKIQGEGEAIWEYLNAKHAAHLSAKAPVNGRMVMNKMPGVPLIKYKYSKHSRRQLFILSKAVAYAIKTQLVDNKLIHDDLHEENILVKWTGIKTCEVNIIDYGLAQYNETINMLDISTDIFRFQDSILYWIWHECSGIPSGIKAILDEPKSLESIINILDKTMVAPTPDAQIHLDNYLKYLYTLKNSNESLADELIQRMNDILTNCRINDLAPMRAEIEYACDRVKDRNFPCIILDDNPEKQKIYNHILQYLDHLEEKGSALIKLGRINDGIETKTLTRYLKEVTRQAAYTEGSNAYQTLISCGERCKEILDSKGDLLQVHRNKSYIAAEIGVILGCLIVLYPIVAGLHYLKTQRFTFFGHTASSIGAKEFNENYLKLTAVK